MTIQHLPGGGSEHAEKTEPARKGKAEAEKGSPQSAGSLTTDGEKQDPKGNTPTAKSGKPSEKDGAPHKH